jgi:hypothetical protein
VLDESQPNATVIEFLNEGSGTAVHLQYVTESPTGELMACSVGDLAPGATLSSRPSGGINPADPLRLVWCCKDSKGRLRTWSYDGRTKRLRGDSAATTEAAFRAMYH